MGVFIFAKSDTSKPSSVRHTKYCLGRNHFRRVFRGWMRRWSWITAFCGGWDWGNQGSLCCRRWDLYTSLLLLGVVQHMQIWVIVSAWGQREVGWSSSCAQLVCKIDSEPIVKVFLKWLQLATCLEQVVLIKDGPDKKLMDRTLVKWTGFWSALFPLTEIWGKLLNTSKLCLHFQIHNAYHIRILWGLNHLIYVKPAQVIAP